MRLIYELTDEFGTHYIDLSSVNRLLVSRGLGSISIIFEETEEGFMSVPYDETLIELFKQRGNDE